MELRKLKDFSQVKRIYHTRMKRDFSRRELRPLFLLKHVWNREEYDCLGLYEDQDLLAYSFFSRMSGDSNDNYLLDYYAVDVGHRGEGIGSYFLKCLSEKLKDAGSIIVEVEDPDYATDPADKKLRERRLEFYLKNGLYETPIRSCVFGEHYRIIGIPTTHSLDPDELRKVYKTIYRRLLPFGLTYFFFKITN